MVGGGQAGLSVSYNLRQAGVEHVVFEKETAMHKWRDSRWDNFCLVTPNWQCRLPGHEYDGADPQGFMVKPQILDYLEAFRRKVDAPIREGVAVSSVERSGDVFQVTTGEGVCTADAVYLATSLYGEPLKPRAAERAPEGILQIHSSGYRNAEALPAGAVVVVGSGQSGAQIAEDLHLAGRQVHLVTGNSPRCARFYRGRDVVDWLWDVGQYEINVGADGMGRKRDETNHYLTGRDGGRDIDLRLFATQGMKLYGRLETIDGPRLRFRPNLTKNLDDADRVYNGINALIDRHIAAKGLDAPAARRLFARLGARVRPAGVGPCRRGGLDDSVGDRFRTGLVLCALADLRRDRLSRALARRNERAGALCGWTAVAVDVGLRAFSERRSGRRICGDAGDQAARGACGGVTN